MEALLCGSMEDATQPVRATATKAIRLRRSNGISKFFKVDSPYYGTGYSGSTALVMTSWSGSADHDPTDIRAANLSDNIDALILPPPAMLTLGFLQSASYTRARLARLRAPDRPRHRGRYRRDDLSRYVVEGTAGRGGDFPAARPCRSQLYRGQSATSASRTAPCLRPPSDRRTAR